MPTPTPSAEEVAGWCTRFIADRLNIEYRDINPEMEFDDFGLDSALITEMLIELEEWLGIELPPQIIFAESTVSKLSRVIAGQLVSSPKISSPTP